MVHKLVLLKSYREHHFRSNINVIVMSLDNVCCSVCIGGRLLWSQKFVCKTSNKNIKMSSFKSSENIQKKEVGPDRSVSDNQSSSVTLNELAIKARKIL